MASAGKDVVKRAYEAFQRGDIRAVLDTMDPRITWFVPGPPDLPYSGRRRGKVEVEQFFATLDALLQFLEFSPNQFVEQGETVVALGTGRLRVKATGQEVAEEWAHVFTVRNGIIVDFHEYADTNAMVEAFRAGAARIG